MFRSYLAVPRPLLSHLRRHEWLPSVARLDRRADLPDRIPSRSYTSSEDDTDVDLPEAKPTQACACRYGHHKSINYKQRHLYVVLEDWKKGFSIHKFDLNDGSDAGGDLALRPPVHRQEKQQHGVSWNFAALGSKIIATGSLNYEDDDATIVYDTKTAGLSIAPRLPIELNGAWKLAAAMGYSLYVFDPIMQTTRWTGRCTIPSMDRPEGAPSPGYHETFWSWTSIRAQPPFNISGTESSVLHLEGGRRTLFVSTGQWERNPADRPWVLGDMMKLGDREPGTPLALGSFTYIPQTFSYDAGSDEWRRLGEWELPFYGRAHYNAMLDAWVGLHRAPFHHMADGYICACDVVPPDGSPTQPTWKLSTDRLFDPGTEQHLSASLVHKGDMNYCLVEIVARETFRRERCGLAGNKCAVRLSTFRLQYGRNGELTIAAPRSERSYRFSRFYSNHRVKVHAFWM